ncbi:MAG: 50S ribosomal protein L25 [Anaerolineaceae bacterium]|jgi:large subunit ribosomal protein L25|nr:50S ribosomal protein L25 [Anaerolineaceae bacterium]MDD4043002.1 50S ribosomal protein L25 [Anaerolineaceae bacterium]MDD4578265.1 50S ribosomal protein L25 [Anaerolineaceae bacterium]
MTTKQDDIIIKVEKRAVTGKQVAKLRRQGILPGVVYGHKVDTYPIQMDTHSTSLMMRKITPTTLITLDQDGKKTRAIIRDRSYDVVTGHLLHLDFFAVSMTEKLRANVAIELIGEAPVLDEVPGSLINQVLNELEIEALPADILERIEVDISGIASADDTISVGDLDLGDKITIHTPQDEVIVSVGYVAAEEEEPVELEEGGAEPEVLEKGKKEEEEED